MARKKHYEAAVIKKGGKVFGHDRVCLNCDSFCHDKGTDRGYCCSMDGKVAIRGKCSDFIWREP